MSTKRIKTTAEYAAVLKEVDGLMSAELGTLEGERLRALAALVEACEAKNFPINPATRAASKPRL